MEQKRCYYIDWLRISAIIIVFFFHNMRFFDFMGWHVKNQQQSEIVMQIVFFVFPWIMPLFLLLSGAGSFFALRSRKQMRFIRDRFKRLMIPYLVGLILLIPPQKYLESLFYSNFEGTYIKFLSGYIPFVFNINIGFSPGWFGHLGYHLWFLAFLFIYSLLSLPLIHFFGTEKGKKFISSLCSICTKPFGIFLFIIPLAVVAISVRAAFPQYLHWADFFYFLLFYIYGYIFISDKRLVRAISEQSTALFVTGLACYSVFLYLSLFTDHMRSWFEHPSYSFGYLFFQFLRSINDFAWTVFFLSIGIKFFNSAAKKLKYLNEAVLPFYILHQTMILLIGFYVVQLSVPIFVKFLIITSSSFLVIGIIYEFLIRRIKPLRFLFGMRVVKVAQQTTRHQPAQSILLKD